MKRLLVVDDMESVRGVLSAIARECDFEVRQASNGEQALQLTRKISFDAILSDWNMPEMCGDEFVKRYRAEGGRAPVVMVTAEADREKVMALAEVGIQGYILKPFKRETLLKALQALRRRIPKE